MGTDYLNRFEAIVEFGYDVKSPVKDLISKTHTYDNCCSLPMRKHHHDPVPPPTLTSHDSSYWQSDHLQSAYPLTQVTVTVWPSITVVADKPSVPAASKSTPVAPLESTVEPMRVVPIHPVN